MVDVVDGEIGEVTVLANAPHVEGGCMAPVLVLAEHMVDAIVVDGIGGRPLMGFNQVGIAVHAGVGADVQTAVQALHPGRPARGRARGRLPALTCRQDVKARRRLGRSGEAPQPPSASSARAARRSRGRRARPVRGVSP